MAALNTFSIQRTGLSRSLEQAMNPNDGDTGGDTSYISLHFLHGRVSGFFLLSDPDLAQRRQSKWRLEFVTEVQLNHGVKLTETKGISSENSLFDVLVLA